MKVIDTKFVGLKIIRHDVYKDRRGYLRVTHDQKINKKKNFVFEYCTNSRKNALRGFHFQHKFQQAKYVSVIKGKILDCVIDLRKESKTFGRYFKIILSEKNSLSLYIPEGFAHGYYSYEKENIIYYKLTNYYHPKYEDGVNVLDKNLKLKWPGNTFSISKKDKILNSFSEFKKKFSSL